MKKIVTLICKGFIIGVGKVMPGVSGSLLAVSLGIYEEAVHRVRYFYINKKENFFFLGSLGIGAILAIMLGSKGIHYFLDRFPLFTMCLFTGLIGGIIPSITKKVEKKNKYYYITVGITIVTLLLLLCRTSYQEFTYLNTFKQNVQVFLMGNLEAFSMITPGISGTSIYMILGYYSFILDLFANFLHYFLTDFQIPLLFGGGLLIGTYLTSVLMDFLFHKKEQMTYAMITGFAYVSLYWMAFSSFQSAHTVSQIILGFIAVIIGFLVSSRFE